MLANTVYTDKGPCEIVNVADARTIHEQSLSSCHSAERQISELQWSRNHGSAAAWPSNTNSGYEPEALETQRSDDYEWRKGLKLFSCLREDPQMAVFAEVDQSFADSEDAGAAAEKAERAQYELLKQLSVDAQTARRMQEAELTSNHSRGHFHQSRNTMRDGAFDEGAFGFKAPVTVPTPVRLFQRR